uniref:CCHC-type domain-containing protein n=1 Tax=Panagrolaimus superbus TaxID=310955 RepID=A0A914YJZ5_9BILA
MSGPIRRKLAPMVARLKRYINDAETDIPATDAMPTDEDAIIDLSRAMKEHMRKIGNCSHQVNEETNKWTTLISCLSSQERATEEAEWNKFDDNGKLSETIDKARETLENLQSLEIELRDTTSDLSDDEKPDDDIPGDKVDNGTKTDGTTAISTNKIRQDIIKLPNIDIKHYSGDPLEFAAFDEAFDAIIDSQPLAPIVKLNYLITYLDGSAKQAVDGYRIIGSNYPIIRAALAKRLGNVDTIKASLHAELDNLAPAIEGKVESLRNVIESINRIIRQMEAHGEVVDHPHIYTAIMKKVPKSVLKMLLQEKSRSTVWDFQKIEDELQRIVSLQEDVDRAYAESHPLHPTSNASNSLAPRATVMNVVRTPTTPCLLCNHFHWTQDCSTYTSGEARQQRIRELNACFKCLRTGHSSRQCNKKVVCHYCKHNHHTATCRLKSGGHQRNPRTKQYQHRDTHYPQHNRSNSWSGPAPQRSYERSSQPRPNQYVNRQHTQNRAPTPCNNRQTDQNRPSTTRQVNFAVPDHHVPATGANLTPLGPPRSEERAAFSVNTEKTQTTLLTLHIDSFNP